jgi:hypothetical protein
MSSSIVGCKKTGTSSSSTTSSTPPLATKKALKEYSQPAAISERVFLNLEAQQLLSVWLSSARMSIVVVEAQPPDWLLTYLERLKQQNPAVQIYCATPRISDTAFHVTVADLKASYIVIDGSSLILNPIYDASTKGLMYVQNNSSIINDYLGFANYLFNGAY